MIVYLLLILGALYFTFIAAPKAINSNDWPQAQGKITSSEIVQRSRTHRTGKRITIYSARIHYQYAVDNKSLTNHQLKWADRNSSGKVEQNMNNKYPVDANVTVFYNPENPSVSVLQKGLSLGHILTGLFLLGGIGAMAYSMFKNARNRRF